jgi:hypothetical protein
MMRFHPKGFKPAQGHYWTARLRLTHSRPERTAEDVNRFVICEQSHLAHCVAAIDAMHLQSYRAQLQCVEDSVSAR